MTLVQSPSPQQGTNDGSSPATLAFGSNNTAGNIIVVAVVNKTDGTGGSSIAPSISDSNGNTYNQIDSAFGFATNAAATLWWASNILGGANTVSADFSGVTATATSPYALVIMEFFPASTRVGHNNGTGNSSTADPGSVTSSTINSLFLALAGADISHEATFTVPSGYTTVASDTNSGASNTQQAYHMAYFVGNGTQHATFAIDVSQLWGAVAGALVTPVNSAAQASMFLVG